VLTFESDAVNVVVKFFLERYETALALINEFPLDVLEFAIIVDLTQHGAQFVGSEVGQLCKTCAVRKIA
jgi:hypothetical protein